jgi:hypothetical protein
MNLCQLCETRKPKRFCPAVRGEICSPCCGEQREVSIDCPLDCEYLLEARLHQAPPDVDPRQFPNQDIQVSDSFLRDNDQVLLFLARTLLEAALVTPGATDLDVREALAAMIKTYRTLESGLIYQTTSPNPYAATIQQRVETALLEFRERMQQSMGMHTVRDAQVLGILVFLQRLELQHNNGRRRSRAFLSFLFSYFPPRTGEEVAIVHP